MYIASLAREFSSSPDARINFALRPSETDGYIYTSLSLSHLDVCVDCVVRVLSRLRFLSLERGGGGAGVGAKWIVLSTLPLLNTIRFHLQFMRMRKAPPPAMLRNVYVYTFDLYKRTSLILYLE